MNSHHRISRLSFNAKTLRGLEKKNLFLAGSTYLPDSSGSFLNGQVGFLLSDGKIKTYLEVLKLAE